MHASRGAVGAAVLAMAALAVGSVLPASATQGSGDNVTICHRTNSVTNPYTQNTVDRSAVNGIDDEQGRGDHFLNHTGPVFDPAKQYPPPMSEDDWGDIIPPVAGYHSGLNWDAAGKAMWDNGCTIVVPPPTTTDPPVTTTDPPVTTTDPPVTTTEPPVTTTDPPVTTTDPPVTTTEPPVTTTDPPVTGGGGEPPAQGATAADEPGGAVQGQPPAAASGGNEVPAAMTDGADLAAPSPLGRGLQLAGVLLLLVAAGLSVRVEDRT